MRDKAMRGRARRFGRGLALGLGLVAGAGPGAKADDAKLADYFGFLPVEVYKLENRIMNVLARDVDGDKVDDVIVANNARSRIDLLLSTKKGTGSDELAGGKEVNDLPSDRRMGLVSLPVNKQVVSMQAGDFDGDGKADLVFYGTPAALEIHRNRGEGRFGDVKTINVGEAVEGQGALSVADLDADGRDDIALITDDEVVLIFQKSRGAMGEPERLPHTLDQPRMVKAVDLDGDGLVDLAMLNGGADDPIRARFATEAGVFGPEERLNVEALRAYAFGDVDGKPGSELSIIEQSSGRTRVLKLGLDDGDDAGRGRIAFYPLPPGDASGRSIGLGDLDGDGSVEVVATDPGLARMLLYRRSGKAGMGQGKVFPGLVGGGLVKVADVDGDGKAEVYVLSEKSKQIGQSLLKDGRLTFPSPLPTEGDPVAFEVADVDGDRKPEVVYVTRDKAKTSTADVFTLRALTRDQAGKFAKNVLEVELKGIGGVPPRLVVADINRDNQPDVLVFNSYGPPALLLGRKGDAPVPPTGGLGPLAEVEPTGLTVADLDGPSLLVARQEFARKIRLDGDGRWSVAEQFDSGRPSSSIRGVAAIDTDGDGVKEIALLDRPSKSLLFLARKDGNYVPAGKLSVGSFDDFVGMHVADLDGDGKDDLVLAGTSRFGVVTAGRPARKFSTIASYESNRTDARFGDLIVGDLNDDRRADVTLTDVAEHFVEIATYEPGEADLARGASFKVFERKGRRAVGDTIEPRDMTLGDVDGDKKTDLVLIVHDRVLIYRQDPGPSADKGGKDKPKVDNEAVKAAGSAGL